MRPRLLAPLAAVLALALSACGGEPPLPPPPVEPPSTWTLARLGALPPPQREWTSPEGVRVLILREGEGEPAVLDTPMDLRIVGRLRDGVTFLSDVIGVNKRPGQPSQPRVPGFQHALGGLKAGERRLVLIPAAQGYGATPPSSIIPPHADLVFDVTRLRLKIQDLAIGSGPEAKLGQNLLVHYRGMLEDGTVFDDSRVNNKSAPLSLPLRRPDGTQGGVIEGWARGLPGMRVGGMRRLEIPSHLAYGERGSPNGMVPAHADLVFVVELVRIDE